jgi:hypothetical protein
MARFLLLLFSSALLTSNLASSFQFGKRLFGGRRGNKNVELPKQEKNGVEKQVRECIYDYWSLGTRVFFFFF